MKHLFLVIFLITMSLGFKVEFANGQTTACKYCQQMVGLCLYACAFDPAKYQDCRNINTNFCTGNDAVCKAGQKEAKDKIAECVQPQ